MTIVEFIGYLILYFTLLWSFYWGLCWIIKTIGGSLLFGDKFIFQIKQKKYYRNFYK